jgi:hypothetical protein
MNNVQTGADIIHSYCFKVSFSLYDTGLNVEIGFSKISSIKDSLEVDTIVEGSGQVHLIPKPGTPLKTITFSKGASKNASLLLEFLKVGAVFDTVKVEVGKGIVDFDMGLDIFNKRHFILKNCVITGYSISDLNANDSSVSFESFEISYASRVEVY